MRQREYTLCPKALIVLYLLWRVSPCPKTTIYLGSSCSVRGSDELAAKLEEYIESEQASNRVALVGSFCMGKCSRRVSIRFADTQYREINPADAETSLHDAGLPHVPPTEAA